MAQSAILQQHYSCPHPQRKQTAESVSEKTPSGRIVTVVSGETTVASGESRNILPSVCVKEVELTNKQKEKMKTRVTYQRTAEASETFQNNPEATQHFSAVTRNFSVLTRELSVLTRGFLAVTRNFSVLTQELSVLTQGFLAVTQNCLVVSPDFLAACKKQKSIKKQNIN